MAAVVQQKSEGFQADGSGSSSSSATNQCSNKKGKSRTTRPNASEQNVGPRRSSAVSYHSSSQSCCFCWYRCFRCKCLSSKTHDEAAEQSSKSREVSSNKASCNIDQENMPSVEEIRSWSESFDRLMRSVSGRAVFREFLKCEYSEENILFWLACEDLKKETNPDIIEEKARVIYEDFISILSPKEVSLDSRVRELVNRNMVTPTSQTFDDAQLQIYTLMHRDSYPRFINSPFYKKLAQLSTNSRRESLA